MFALFDIQSLAAFAATAAVCCSAGNDLWYVDSPIGYLLAAPELPGRYHVV